MKWSDLVNNPDNKINLSNKFFKLMDFLEVERGTASYRVNVMGRTFKTNKHDLQKTDVVSKGR